MTQQLPFSVKVRFNSGAYETNTVQGQRASCTSSARAAVELLARKLLPSVETVVAQHPEDAKLWAIVPTSWTPPAGTPVVTLVFEDHGQDFLEWGVEPTTGFIFSCEPFQADFWVGRRVTDRIAELKVGDRVSLDVVVDGQALVINYPLAKLLPSGAV